MRKWTMAILPLAVAMTATGCSGADKDRTGAQGGAEQSADPGPTTTRSFALDGFTAVEIAGPDDVTIRRGAPFAITAKGPQVEIDDLEIKRDGSALSIGRQRDGFNLSRSDHDGVAIAITMPGLEKLRLTGSGDVDADVIEGDAVEATITGSGDMKIARLTGEAAEVAVSGSGNIEIGGGTVVAGDYSVTGSGDIDADDLAATDVDIAITGSGDVEARATGKAKVRILGSGDVALTGGATCSTQQMGSGSVTCK